MEKTSEYPDVTSKFDIPSGSNAIVVWVEWSSGDSFGSHYAGSSEAVGIFTDIKAAKELKQHIETKDWDKEPQLSFATSDGQEFNIGFAGWVGYFESIVVRIDAVKVF